MTHTPTRDNPDLVIASKLMYEVLTEMISQKNIGKLAFDIGKLNEGFIAYERFKRESKAGAV